MKVFLTRLAGIMSAILNGSIISFIAVAVYLTMGPPYPTVQAETRGENKPDFSIVTEDDYLFEMSDWYSNVSKEEVTCLVQNAYHEARSDGYAGMYAVTMVVMNRVSDPRYPDTICEVIQQGPVRESWKTRQHADLPDEERIYYPVKNRCQFSWYCDGKPDVMHDEDAFFLAQEIATLVVRAWMGEYPLADITEGSTHYHTNYVAPNWRHDRGMYKVTRVGVHYFYRWEILG